MRRPLRGWMICELNVEYLKDQSFPMLIERNLATAAGIDYYVQVVTSGEPHRVVFASDSSVSERIMEKPDTVAGLFQMRGQPVGPEGRRPPLGELRREGPRRERRGEWQLLARHKAGSVESAIAALHRRNLVLSSASLALLAGAFALLILSNRRAQRLAQQQVEFVAGVTHELRTPLTVICAAAENLVDGVVSSPERVQTYGAAIKKEGGRLVDVVEKIFRFARLETGRAAYDLKPVELEPLVRQAIAACEAEGVESGSVDVSIPIGLRVMADGPAFSHCVRNLVSNAWKYGGEHKRVRVRATQVAAQTRIDVEDEGIGMDSSDARRVFEPFFRGRAATERQIGGAGLGLTLVKGIVDGHRGKIEVSSAPGKGSRFTIVLPKSGNGSQNSAG
jgi:signal transduction histidine kinase